MARTTASSGVISMLLMGILLMLTMGSAVEGRRGTVMCDGDRFLGDKWFDGCQWCVCTARGPQCSRSGCSSLVHKVAPCHEERQQWTDGCYRCRCKRRGIDCQIDVICLLLRHDPVPCLADDRCVCGPDGVPSCTAEVIDRHAFAATRVDLEVPSLLPQGHETSRSRGGRRGGKFFGSSFNKIEKEVKDDESSQELLITSDNLCRFGPRWYGGSLRCFCDIDGSITCGNPAFVSAFFDDFMVRREECEKSHIWEEGCDVCSCRVNGVVFCRRDNQCRHDIGNLHRDNTYDDNDDDDSNKIDFYLPGSEEKEEEEEGGGLVVAPVRMSPTNTPRTKSTARSPPGDCKPGKRWREGCKRCRCDKQSRIVCSRRSHCKSNAEEKDAVREEEIRASEEDAGEENMKSHHEKETPKKHHQGKEKPHQRKNHEVPEKPKHPHQDETEKAKEHGKDHYKEHQDNKEHHHNSNAANEKPATIKPRGSRVPMMVVPKISSVYRPPAYSRHSAHRVKANPCGKFKAGDIFWDDCNLCLCTSKGPKCQMKMCW
ncbi:uncharacterized protein [Littorina saxatilis]|uniref:VWFC domain-containing protein n=2 Tax=Littorina saxatilis TaxID=31220 RepID=A0AAN9BBM9_9CAEN